MAFLNPLALWLLPLAAVPFLLARRRPERRQVLVSNLDIWSNTDPHDPAHLAVRHPRRNWLVFVQTVFVIVVVMALARPSVPRLISHATFVIDVSASMDARDGNGIRLDRAKARALETLSDLPLLSRVRLISAGASAQDLGEFARGSAARTAIEALRPSAGRSNIEDALDIARASGSDRNIWVFSDRANPESGNASRQWVVVGAPADNVAVTALAARRASESPQHVAVAVEISNHGSVEREVMLTVDVAGKVFVSEQVVLGPRGARSLVRSITGVQGLITARVKSAGDALEADNTRRTVLPPALPIRVNLVSPGNFFLEKVLESNPSVMLGTPNRSEAPGDADVVVCDGCAALPEGEASVLRVMPAPQQAVAPAPVVVSSTHSVVRGLDAMDAWAAATAGAGVDGGEIVVRAGQAPLLTLREDAGRRLAVLHLDLRSAAFPLSPAFPVLIANTLEWLSGRSSNAQDVTSGDPLQWVLPGRESSESVVSVRGPDGAAVPYRWTNGVLTVTETTALGVYTVTGPRGTALFAVNPATQTESDLAQDTAEPPASDGAALSDLPASSELTMPLALVALFLLGLEWKLSGRGFRGGQMAWRIAALSAVLLALANPRVPIGRAPITVAFVLDQSDSVPVRAQRDARARVREALPAMETDDRAGIVVFGADAAIETRPVHRPSVGDGGPAISSGGTNIEASLRLARRVLPSTGSRRIVLLSDGHQTAGNATREAALAAADDIRIDVAPLEVGRDARLPVLQAVRAPEEVRVGEPFIVSVVVTGPPGGRVGVAILSDGEPRLSNQVEISSDGSGVLATTHRRSDAGTYFFRAALEEDEPVPSVGAAVTVVSRPSVLYVSTRTTEGLPAVLRSAGFDVVHPPLSEAPTTDAALRRFEAVILDDVPGERLSPPQTAALSRFVERSGGGLLVLGDPDSLEAAGSQGTPFGDLLPIDLRPRPGQRSPAAAFVVVFDKSGSMADRQSGIQKIELARQAVLRVLGIIPATDSLGVIGFDAQPVPVATLRSSHDAREISDALRRIEPGGSTSIAPALDLAAQWLRDAQVERRHVLLVSDGRTSPADEERLRVLVRSRPFELSVVAVGADSDRTLMRQLAESTGGRAYFPDDKRDLPLIAARDAALSRGGSTVEESFTVRAPSAHPVLTGIERQSLPRLNGYVVSSLRSGAQAILASHLDDPILAAWRVGLGRVAVFTAGTGSARSAPMEQWRGFAQFWTQTVRWLGRQATNESLRASLIEQDDGIGLKVDVRDDNGVVPDVDDARATVRTPSGRVERIRLATVGPGRFEGHITAPEPGAYEVELATRLDGVAQREARLVRGFYWSPVRERPSSDANRELLLNLANATGGTVLAAASNPFDGPRPADYRHTRTTLLAISVLLFLVRLLTGGRLPVGMLDRWNRPGGLARRRPATAA